jgi:hypothetical protein
MEEINEEEVQETEIELPDIDQLEKLMPKLDMPVPAAQEGTACLVSDDQLLDIYQEIIDNIREDRKEVSEYVDNFANMIINDGDATSASKEAFVQLVNIKSSMPEKMAKIAELMTRLKMKEKNTYVGSGAHFNAIQNNTVNIKSERREQIKAIAEAKKKGKAK